MNAVLMQLEKCLIQVEDFLVYFQSNIDMWLLVIQGAGEATVTYRLYIKDVTAQSHLLVL